MTTKTKLVLLVLGYCVLSAALTPLYLYHINNDGVAYLSMARLMASGHAYDTLNVYWNPLLPVLFSLGIRFGLAPVLAAKVVLFATGLIVTLLLCCYRRVLPVSNGVWNITIITAALLSLSYAINVITPDLVLAIWLLCYGLLLLDERLRQHRLWPLLLAMTIALAYYAKTFALPFLVLHFCCFQTIASFSGRKNLVRPSLLALLVAGILVAPWIIFISSIHGSFTIGENSRFIHAALNPLLGSKIPMNTYGLLPPPHPLATSMWDAPASTAVTDWSPFDSVTHFIDQLKIVFLNVGLFFDLVLTQLLLWPLSAIAIVLACGRGEDRLRVFARFVALACVIALSLYLPFIIEERYFWWHVFLSLLLGASLLSLLFESFPVTRLQRSLALLFFSCSYLAYPAWQLAFNYRDGERQYHSMISLDAVHHFQGSRIADDNWKRGLRLAFYTDARFYGKPKAGSDTEVEEELLMHDIQYYLVSDQRARTFSQYREAKQSVSGFRVFERKKR